MLWLVDDDTNMLRPAIIAALLACLFAIASSLDYAEELTTEAIRKDPPAKYFPASLVIPYDVYICQDSGGKKHCRAYVSGLTRKEIRK